jgi:DNA-binding transcriptional LysR family regulator
MYDIDEINNEGELMNFLSGVNLNLLTVLNTLLKEKNVSKAGKKLNLTQPTISNSLKQLRVIFDDELLFRGPGNKMLLTYKAKSLIVPVGETISKIQSVFKSEENFDPKLNEYHFRIGMSDYASIIYLPKIMEVIDKFSDNIGIEVVHLNNMWTYDDFTEHNIDLAIGNYAVDNPVIMKERLFKSHIVCIGAKNHPAFQSQSLTMKDFLKYKHLQVFYKKEFWADVDGIILNKTGGKRDIVLQVPHMLVALSLIKNSEYICLVSDKIASKYAEKYGCAVRCSPINFPGSVYSLYWSKADCGNPANKWMRKIISGIENQ